MKHSTTRPTIAEQARLDALSRMPKKRKTRDPKERLLRFIERREASECWPWTAFIGTWGYGMFWLDGRNINASRAAYLLLVGEIADGLVVCHSCDNPACCNPAHLFLGSQGDNVRDCNRKGRARGLFSEKRGDKHPRYTSKLTEDSVRAARVMHYKHGISHSEIARRFGVSNSVLNRAVRGISWSHVK